MNSELSAPSVMRITGFAARALVSTAAVAALIALSSVPASADTDPVAAVESTVATVAVAGGITLSDLPGLNLGGIPGETAAGALAYNVITNNPTGYSVTVQAAANALVADGGNASTIPITALQVDPDATVTGVPFTSVPGTAGPALTIHTQTTPSDAGGDDLTNDYQLLIPSVPFDNYTVTLNYTATVAA
jgi:hypothetical protein